MASSRCWTSRPARGGRRSRSAPESRRQVGVSSHDRTSSIPVLSRPNARRSQPGVSSSAAAPMPHADASVETHEGRSAGNCCCFVAAVRQLPFSLTRHSSAAWFPEFRDCDHTVIEGALALERQQMAAAYRRRADDPVVSLKPGARRPAANRGRRPASSLTVDRGPA